MYVYTHTYMYTYMSGRLSRTFAGEEVDEGEARVLVLVPHPGQEEEVVGGA